MTVGRQGEYHLHIISITLEILKNDMRYAIHVLFTYLFTAIYVTTATLRSLPPPLPLLLYYLLQYPPPPPPPFGLTS